MTRAYRLAVLILCLWFVLPRSAPAADAARPKVRTICAFLVIDRSGYREQFAAALSMLRAARSEYEKNGWEVETIRITTQPFLQYVKGLSHRDALRFLMELDGLAEKEDFLLNIGPAMMKDEDDPAMMELLGEVLARAKVINATTLIAAEDGIHWKTVRAAARMVKSVAEHSRNSQGTFSFAAAAMVKPYTPFYPASYHTGTGRRFAVGLESAHVVARVLAETRGDPAAAASRLSAELDRYTGIAEQVALAVAQQTGWEYMGIDPTPAPLMDVSIGAAIEAYTGQRFGSSGTLTAARIITEAVRSVRAKQVGYSGLMLPVMEDRRIARRWSEGAVSLDALLAYSAVCATGLDTVPLPGDIPEEQIARIFGDVASLAVKWKKPLTARLQPVTGKKAGEMTAFNDPYLENAVLQPLP
jgi:uncharacterized protein (UPF0210 family)